MARENRQLIGLDWGTSVLRAYVMSGQGTVLDVKIEPWGVMSVSGADFAGAYHAVVAGWRAADPGLPAIAAGMIGSTEGWVEAPYCGCPAGPGELAAALVAIDAGSDGIIHVVPGLESRGPVPGVMRGEETQVAGALALRPELAAEATLVLPGTHSKWVDVCAGRVVDFRTYMTGELFAVLRDHSILGRPARKAAGDAARGSAAWDAFARGVRAAQEHEQGGIAPLLFLTRALVLQRSLLAEESLDFLSGLLIGDELRSGLGARSQRLALVGDPILCERYRRALELFGITATPVIDAAAPAGLWRIAAQAGLTSSSMQHV